MLVICLHVSQNGFLFSFTSTFWASFAVVFTALPLLSFRILFPPIYFCLYLPLYFFFTPLEVTFDVEYIYGFVMPGGFVRQVDDVTANRSSGPSRLRAQHRNIKTTRWRLCVTTETLWQQQYGGYVLLWKRPTTKKKQVQSTTVLLKM